MQTGPDHVDAQRMVLRNTLLLALSQVLAVPLALAINIAAARYLGAADYGQIYLATTFVSFAFVFVEWGQSIGTTGAIARNREHAGELLASGMALRLVLAPIALLLMVIVSLFMGYGASFRWLLLLATLGALATSLSGALQDALRAFERMDLSVKASIPGQALTGLVVFAVLLSGGGLHSFLLAQGVCALLGCFILAWAVRRLGMQGLRVRLQRLRQLLVQGAPFLVFALVLVLQPTVDAYFLSQLVPQEVVGWNAVARKLLTVLVYPALALVGALYPTLCRLQANDPQHLGPTVSGALRLSMLVGMAAGLGCIFYPELGVSIFGLQTYAHTSENLRVLGIFIVLVYVSMPISCALMALGKQRVWSAVQLLCVVFSLVLDPLLIPWFQMHYGNGGIGVCVASVVSELAMVAAAIVLLPKGLLQAYLRRTAIAVVVAGLAMAGMALLLQGVNIWLAAPCAILAYAAVAWLFGEVRKALFFVREGAAQPANAS